MWYAHSTLQNFVQLALLHQLRMGRGLGLQLHCHFLPAGDGDAQVDVAEGAAADLPDESVAPSYDELSAGHNPQVVHFPSQLAGVVWVDGWKMNTAGCC